MILNVVFGTFRTQVRCILDGNVYLNILTGKKNGSVRLAFEGFTFLTCDTFSDSQTSRAEKREILQKKRSKIVHSD